MMTDRNELISKSARDVQQGAWIIGIDEAGRGPVLGPMVYAAAYCPVTFEPELKEMGVADSKTLTPEQRQMHMQTVYATPELGFVADPIPASTISSKMLEKLSKPLEASLREICRSPTSLNLVALESTIGLLSALLRQGISVEHVFVDTLGKPAAHQQRLKTAFPELQITVKAKADVLFPIVSLASIVAKVIRDAAIEKIQRTTPIPIGCGYPSDSTTQDWIKSTMDPIFGFSRDIRFSWSTCSNLLNKDAVETTEDPLFSRTENYTHSEMTPSSRDVFLAAKTG